MASFLRNGKQKITTDFCWLSKMAAFLDPLNFFTENFSLIHHASKWPSFLSESHRYLHLFRLRIETNYKTTTTKITESFSSHSHKKVAGAARFNLDFSVGFLNAILVRGVLETLGNLSKGSRILAKTKRKQKSEVLAYLWKLLVKDSVSSFCVTSLHFDSGIWTRLSFSAMTWFEVATSCSSFWFKSFWQEFNSLETFSFRLEREDILTLDF